jgi:prevent-host-death family protein
VDEGKNRTAAQAPPKVCWFSAFPEGVNILFSAKYGLYLAIHLRRHGANTMTLASQIKPISYLKSNAADIVKNFAINPEPLIITQNGEAKMVVVEINQYERQQEQLALLRLIALGRKEYLSGNHTDVQTFFEEMDKEG